MNGTSDTCRKNGIVPPGVVTHLSSSFEEGQGLDVAHRAADLGDYHVDVGPGHRADAVLDLVGDVRDDLNGVAEVVASPLLGDDARVHLTGGDVRRFGQVHVEEPFVVTHVEVGFRAIVGYEDLTVLERVHRAGVDVEVGVELLHGHP
jgi:hypothetical protein